MHHDRGINKSVISDFMPRDWLYFRCTIRQVAEHKRVLDDARGYSAVSDSLFYGTDYSRGRYYQIHVLYCVSKR